MTFLKDLNEFHITLKSFVMSLIVIMPFWFVAIFLLHRDFYNSVPFVIPVIFSFCFTLINYALVHIPIDTVKKRTMDEAEKARGFDYYVVVLFYTTTFFCVLGMSVTICAAYALKWDFIKFLKFTYIPMGSVSLFIVLIKDWFRPSNKRKQIKKDNEV